MADDAPVRVHYHSDCYWFGGSEHVLLLLLAAARSNNVSPSFTYRAEPEYTVDLIRRSGGEVDGTPLTLPSPATARSRVSGSALVSKLSRLVPLKWIFFVYDVIALWPRLRRSRPEVLHVNSGGFPGAVSCAAAVVAGRLAGVRQIVFVVNNLATGYETWSRRLDWPVDKILKRVVTRFVTGSQASARSLTHFIGIDPARITVIPNSILEGSSAEPRADTRSRLGVDPETVMLLTVARLEVRKGHAVLLRALDGLEGDWVAAFAGGGPERAELERVAASLGLRNRVRFLGDVKDVWALYAAADVVVLPSIEGEDFPITVLEAMSEGLPVVGTDVAGMPEQILDGGTGRVVPSHDPAALRRALANLTGSPTARQEMGTAGRARYETEYRPAVTTGRYRALYRELVGR